MSLFKCSCAFEPVQFYTLKPVLRLRLSLRLHSAAYMGAFFFFFNGKSPKTSPLFIFMPWLNGRNVLYVLYGLDKPFFSAEQVLALTKRA